MKKLLLTLFSLVFMYTIANAQVTCPPTIPHFDFSFTKPVVVDQKVGGVSVCDVDAGQTHTWTIIETGIPWKIVNGNILVADANAINSVTTAAYNITIKVTDNGTNPPNLSATTTVTLNNINSPPIIAPQTFTVAENAPNATLVGTVVSSDPNAGQTKTYSIVSGNTSGAFSINASNGNILVTNTSVLNFEVTPSFALVVKVTDNGNPSLNAQATITINLTDVNEAPVVVDQTFQ
jgi:VCBS repeat-containing protein